MLFNSTIFTALFLPLCLIGWYGLQQFKNPAWAKLFLVGMSLWFYGYYNPWYLLILVGSLFVNQGISTAMERLSGKGQETSAQAAGKVPGSRKLLLTLGLIANIGLLFYFKYFNFFVDNCNFFFHTDWQIEKIALPLGISFFTFQQISYVVDRYKGEAPCYSLLDYACFVTFFPQLIAGPIVLHSEFIPALQARKNRKPDWEMFYDGVALFVLGFGKKVLLADVLALLVNSVFDVVGVVQYYLDFWTGLITILCYGFQLYFDFSGYCDMARGIGRMFGFELPVNFRSPFKADSVRDIWKRWHVTLGRFLTAYVYIPLGGNRKGKARKCLNLFLVFLVSGIWHGANWTYILWGVMHGVAIVWENLFPKLRFRSRKLNVFFTQIFWFLTLIMFRSNTLSQAGYFYRNLFTAPKPFLNGIGAALQIPENFIIIKALTLKAPQYLPVFYFVMIGLMLAVSFFFAYGKEAGEWIKTKARTKKGAFLLAVVFLWGFVSLSQVSTFLYFNF